MASGHVRGTPQETPSFPSLIGNLMNQPTYHPLKDEDIQALLKQAHASSHGLIVGVASAKDLDILKRRVWEWNKKLDLPPISCRTSPKNPRGELWLVKVGDHGKAPGAGDKEVHDTADQRESGGADEVPS